MNNRTPIIVGGVILLGLIVYFAIYQPKYHDWSSRYEQDGKSPYSVKVFYNVLDKYFEMEDFDERVEEELSKENAKGTTYLYIGDEPKYTEDEAWHLREYVKAGGNAFIITEHVPDSLAQFLFYPEDCGSMTNWMGQNTRYSNSKVYAEFTHPSINEDFYEFEYIYENFPRLTTWYYIPDGVFCNSEKREFPIAKLGGFQASKKVGQIMQNAAHVNFVRIKVGEGHIYFHTNPIMFTNFYMVDTVGFEYVNHVVSHIPTEKIYWDKESEKVARKNNQIARQRPSIPAQSPLEYIFSQSALRWSWYLFLSLGLLYVLFRAKRRQRGIPILQSNRNTSLEFVETIGNLYFQQQDHKGIIRKQMHLFLAHLRQRYHLVTRDLDDKLIDRIVVRARVDRNIVQDIFKEYERLKKYIYKPTGTISVDVLNNFYLLIERFHQAEKQNKFEKEEK